MWATVRLQFILIWRMTAWGRQISQPFFVILRSKTISYRYVLKRQIIELVESNRQVLKWIRIYWFSSQKFAGRWKVWINERPVTKNAETFEWANIHEEALEGGGGGGTLNQKGTVAHLIWMAGVRPLSSSSGHAPWSTDNPLLLLLLWYANEPGAEEFPIDSLMIHFWWAVGLPWSCVSSLGERLCNGESPQPVATMNDDESSHFAYQTGERSLLTSIDLFTQLLILSRNIC